MFLHCRPGLAIPSAATASADYPEPRDEGRATLTVRPQLEQDDYRVH